MIDEPSSARLDKFLQSPAADCPRVEHDLYSQPTVSRWENEPTLRTRYPPVGCNDRGHCASYARPLHAMTLDNGDTVEVVHGHQQLSLFNAKLTIRGDSHY